MRPPRLPHTPEKLRINGSKRPNQSKIAWCSDTTTQIAKTILKVLANEDTLLRTHCCSWCFLGCANWETFVSDTKCFWTKSETRFVSRTQNLSPQQMLRARANGETFVSATMCPQQCVLVCQGLNREKVRLKIKRFHHYLNEIVRQGFLLDQYCSIRIFVSTIFTQLGCSKVLNLFGQLWFLFQ